MMLTVAPTLSARRRPRRSLSGRATPGHRTWHESTSRAMQSRLQGCRAVRH